MTERFLLDTNVVSELRRSKPNDDVLTFMAREPETLFLSDVTIAEVRAGIRMQQDALLREPIRRWLETALLTQFAERIHPATTDVLATAFGLMRETSRAGATLSTPDLLIAATASFHDLIVVSRDIRPYRQAHVPVLDPWSAAFHPPGGQAHAVDLAARTFRERKP